MADTNYVGAGYGLPREDTLEAIRMFAELEGILLTRSIPGRGCAGLIDWCRSGALHQTSALSSSTGRRGRRPVRLHRAPWREDEDHGILGGMGAGGDGPADSRIIARLPATDDVDHVPLIVDQNPQRAQRIAI